MSDEQRRVAGFELGKKLGQGSFGKVYVGWKSGSKTREEVAVKLEPINAQFPQLLAEAKLYTQLGGVLGIPSCKWSGTEGQFNVLAMDLLGPSLEDLFGYCNKKFSLKTVMMLADQVINRLEYIHSRHLIHRDLKPDNFVMGRGVKSSIVHMIDFGLAIRYRNSKTLEHISYNERSDLTGTARYASVNTHLSIQQSRRDDMESISYLLLYFLRGSLPWQGLKADTKKEKYRKIMEKKVATPVEILCRSLPQEVASFLAYCRQLKFEERPDYGHWRATFRDVLLRSGAEYDLSFEWSDRARVGASGNAGGSSSRASASSRRRSSTDAVTRLA